WNGKIANDHKSHRTLSRAGEAGSLRRGKARGPRGGSSPVEPDRSRAVLPGAAFQQSGKGGRSASVWRSARFRSAAYAGGVGPSRRKAGSDTERTQCLRESAASPLSEWFERVSLLFVADRASGRNGGILAGNRAAP